MTDIDTAALRAAAEDAEQAAYAVSVSLTPATVRALCDGYDEAQRLDAVVSQMGNAEMLWRDACAERDAARQAIADLVADLRALCDRYERADERFNPPTGQQVAAKVSNLIDRHAPATPTTEEDR